MRTLLPLAALVFTAGLTAAEPAVKLADRPPYQRSLQGEDAKRAGELDQGAGEHKTAGGFAEAPPPAEELWQLRRRVQGEDHWQTADARRRVELLRRGAALPPEARADFIAALRLPDE